MSQSKSILKDKSFAFAIETVKTYKILVEEKKEFIMSKQLLRSGTSVGQISGKLKTLKALMTLFINLVLPRRNVMKHFTGWNYFILPNTSIRNHLISFQMKQLKSSK